MTRSTHTIEYRELLTILADARHEAGLTQQQLAGRLAKPQSYIAKLEGGERRLDIVEFVQLAKAMGKDPTHLFQQMLSRFDKD